MPMVAGCIFGGEKAASKLPDHLYIYIYIKAIRSGAAGAALAAPVFESLFYFFYYFLLLLFFNEN